MTVLAVQDLHVRYGRIAALRGVTLEVREGETVGLIGPNGAGKTTLLSAVMGLVRPSAGSIHVHGASIAGQSPEAIARKGLALVREGRHIFATLSVEENLLVGAAIRGRRAAQDDIDQLLERFPILGRARTQPAGRLSGGEQQQLAIARALVSRPKLILLDEPSLGLAPKLVDVVFDILEELKGSGVTILLVEQNARRTVEFADRTYVLSTGTIEFERTRADLVADGAREVEALYLGGARTAQRPA
jgi:branched-chain amino acid transport system ATP-binding protein